MVRGRGRGCEPGRFGRPGGRSVRVLAGVVEAGEFLEVDRLPVLAVDEQADEGDEGEAHDARTPCEVSCVDEKCADADDEEGEDKGQDETRLLAEDIALNDKAARVAFVPVGFVASAALSFGHGHDPFGTAGEGIVVFAEEMRWGKRAVPSRARGDVRFVGFDPIGLRRSQIFGQAILSAFALFVLRQRGLHRACEVGPDRGPVAGDGFGVGPMRSHLQSKAVKGTP